MVLDKADEDSPSRSQSLAVPVTSTPVKQVISCESVAPDLVTMAAELKNLARLYSTLVESMYSH